jgi:integrase
MSDTQNPKKTTQNTGGWKGRLTALLRDHAHKSERHPGKAVSTGTRDKRWTVLFAAFTTLREDLGFKIEEPTNLRLKHVQALVKHWEAAGLSPSTIQNNICILRLYAGWIGKAGMIPDTDSLVSDPARGRRRYVAERDKGWEGNGVDYGEQLERIRAEDPALALQVELAAAFGLRAAETWLLRPGVDVRQEDGQYILTLIRGTKGKRLRYVPIESDCQKDVLERARRFAKLGSMIPADYTKKRWRNHFYWILRKLGLTRDGLGVTMHGLRHQYAHGQYRKLLGVEPAVRGGEAPDLTREETERGRQQLAEELGHSRTSIVGAYTGTPKPVKKPRLDWSIKGSSEPDGQPAGGTDS